MRTRILLLAALVSFTQISSAQKRNHAFAITGINGSAAWNNIAAVDLSKAQVSNRLFSNDASAYALFDATTRKALPAQKTTLVNGKITMTTQSPTETMVAAAAYDEYHNKLFFTPMRINELRWVDLNDHSQTMKVYSVTSQKLINADVQDVPNQITRMCMGADGYGYAMTNDAMHLIRFSTGNNVTITDLGSVVSEKNSLTINNACGGWGGDMVADTKGNLYVVSANHNIFKVNIETRVASFITRLNDIPGEHTTNGAAVDDDGMLILGCATVTDAFYKINPADWSVTKIENKGGQLNVSDLASSNFLFETKKNAGNTPAGDIREVYNEKIIAYPNPVTDGFVRISFNKQPKGNYSIQLVDLMGRVLTGKQVTISANGQLETLNVEQSMAQGFYLLRIMDSNKKTILAKKLFVE